MTTFAFLWCMLSSQYNYEYDILCSFKAFHQIFPPRWKRTFSPRDHTKSGKCDESYLSEKILSHMLLEVLNMFVLRPALFGEIFSKHGTLPW